MSYYILFHDFIIKYRKEISNFICDHYTDFLQFNNVKIYYDNVQIEVSKILSSIFNAMLSEVEFRKVLPSQYKPFQVAVLLCTLATIPDISLDKVPQKEIMDISRAKEIRGRRYSRLNLLSEETIRVLKTISSGEFLLNGFDNKSIRQRIYKDRGNPKVIGKTTRLLTKLKVHGLIKKVPRKNRYYLI